MTPLQMEILLHYYVSPEEYRDGDLSAPAVKDAIHWFLLEGLLDQSRFEEFNKYGGSYRTTDRAKALIQAWLDMPLPVQTWAIPRGEA